MIIKDITKEKEQDLEVSDNLRYLITSSQKSMKLKIEPKKTFVLIPNFAEYSRLLASGKYKDCMNKFKENMKLGKTFLLNLKNIPSLVPLSGVFWPAIIEMSLVDLSSLNKENNLILHPSIVDLAFHSGKQKLIKKLISSAKRSTKGKVGLWTRNINLILSKTGLRDLGVDFIVTPSNKFGAGMRVDENLLLERLETEMIPLIKDHTSYFQSFIDDIDLEKGSSYLI